MIVTLAQLYSYPVKSLGPVPLASADLRPDAGLPDDRRFAIMHGASAFNPLEPAWQPKSSFVVLARTGRLATLDIDYDPATTTLIIRRGGRAVARGQIGTPLGRGLIDQFLAAYLKHAVPGTPRLVEAPGVSFGDRPEPLVTLVNAASVADLERVVKEEVNPLRFRPNLILTGAAPWQEAAWVGKTLAIGAARLEVVDTITRDEVVNIEPRTGNQTLNLLMALDRGFGHRRCGLYARVTTPGTITPGDTVTLGGG